jgi:two-component system, cell cycle response regulator
MAYRVAIIEDEDVLRDLLVQKFEHEGFVVLPAIDGEAGLKVIHQDQPDIILLDIVMPKLNGYDVLQALHDEGKPIPPIIIISNSGQPVEIDKAMNLGARDFIVKAQIDPGEVVAKVNSFLKIKNKVVANIPQKSVMSVKEKKEIAKGIHILMVEDDQFLRDLMRTKLLRENYEVSVAVDGNEGLQKIRSLAPDIVLLDIILPGLDGFRVLEMIRADHSPKTAKTPIILLSNLGQDSDITKGRQLGATDYLVKSSLTIDEIITKIQGILRKQK